MKKTYHYRHVENRNHEVFVKTLNALGQEGYAPVTITNVNGFHIGYVCKEDFVPETSDETETGDAKEPEPGKPQS